MNDGLSRIKLELDIHATRMIQQLQIHNDQLEERVEAGIKKALDELFDRDNFEDSVADLVKDEIEKAIRHAVSDWTLRAKIHDAVHKVIEGKVDAIAERWAAVALKNLENEQPK